MEEKNPVQPTSTPPLTSPISQIPPTTSTGGPKRNIILITIIIFIILIISGSSWYFLTNNKTQTPQKPLPTLTKTPSPTKNPMAKWKIYTNPSKTFSFKYPNTWNIMSEESKLEPSNTVLQSSNYEIAEPLQGGGFIAGASNGDKFEIARGTNSNFQSYEQLKNFMENTSTKFPLDYFTNKREIMIDGTPAMLKTGGKPYKGEETVVYFVKDGQIYDITLISANNQDDLFIQILSTLNLPIRPLHYLPNNPYLPNLPIRLTFISLLWIYFLRY